MFNRPIDHDVLVPHPWDKVFALIVVDGPLIVPEQLAGVAEHQQLRILAAVALLLSRFIMVRLASTAPVHSRKYPQNTRNKRETARNV